MKSIVIKQSMLHLRMRRTKTLHDINQKVIDDIGSAMDRLKENFRPSLELQEVYDELNAKTISEIKSLCQNYENDSFQLAQLKKELKKQENVEAVSKV